jgi:BTB/POZ domain
MKLVINDKDCKKPLRKKPKMIQETEVVGSKTCGFEVLWESNRFTDFTIVVDSKQFPVHKNILGIQSSVFAEIFENDMKERNVEKMEIEDFSSVTVKDFLRFIYTGDIREEENSIGLFKLADMYDVPKLKLIAEELIAYYVNEQNAIEVFNLGNLYKSEKLKKASFKEIEKMYPAIVFPPDLKNKPEAVMELIEGERDCKRKIQELEKEREQEMKNLSEKIRKKKREAEKEFELIMKKYKTE